MNLGFPFKHWILSLLSGGMFLALVMISQTKIWSAGNLLGLYILILFVSIICSSPALLIYLIFYNFLLGYNQSTLRLKTLVISISVVLVLITGMIVYGGEILNPLFFCYSAAIIATGCFLRNKDKDAIPESGVKAQ